MNHLPDDLEDTRAPQCQCQLCPYQIHSQYVYYILHLIFEMGGRRRRGWWEDTEVGPVHGWNTRGGHRHRPRPWCQSLGQSLIVTQPSLSHLQSLVTVWPTNLAPTATNPPCPSPKWTSWIQIKCDELWPSVNMPQYILWLQCDIQDIRWPWRNANIV